MIYLYLYQSEILKSICREYVEWKFRKENHLIYKYGIIFSNRMYTVILHVSKYLVTHKERITCMWRKGVCIILPI